MTVAEDLALTTESRWHKWVAEHPIAAMTTIGVIATQITTVFGYYLVGIGLPSLAWPVFNGVLAAPASEFGSTGSYFVGLTFHYVNGIVFAVLFYATAHTLIPLPNTRVGDVLKAVAFSMTLTFVSVGLLIPYVYLPKQGYGLFSFTGPDGWKLPFSVLLWHLVYGLIIGTLFNPTRQQEVVAGEANRQKTQVSA